MSGVNFGYGWRIQRNGWRVSFQWWRHIEPHKTKSRKVIS